MLRNLVAVMMLLALVTPSMAEPQAPRKPRPPSDGALKSESFKAGAVRTNPCAAFGPGFVAVEGSSTCVKVGGAISLGIGGGAR